LQMAGLWAAICVSDVNIWKLSRCSHPNVRADFNPPFFVFSPSPEPRAVNFPDLLRRGGLRQEHDQLGI
jgi:hypothetical protein